MRLSSIAVAASVLYHVSNVQAFDAGLTPPESFTKNGRAFRHGDIEAVFADFVEAGGTHPVHRVTSWEYRTEDLKRLYFGNWLRDYSQVIDIPALKVINEDLILAFVVTFGYLSQGYAGGEFEITRERLGVYRPEEHIDNPTGYGGGKDPRKYDPRLRPRIDPREVKIDRATGMKSYIRSEGKSWATSTAFIKRQIIDSIKEARAFRNTENLAHRDEAYRLLGSALHTLEDFMAHSNWIELALIELGYDSVFPHVGSDTRIQLPNGKKAFPVVTGTYGSNDATYSLLNAMVDGLTEKSETNLNDEVEEHMEGHKETEDAAPVGYHAGSIAKIEALMNDLVGEENGCKVARKYKVHKTKAKRGDGDESGENEDDDPCKPIDFKDEYWQFVETFDAEEFVKDLENDTERDLTNDDDEENTDAKHSHPKRKLGHIRAHRARRLRRTVQKVVKLMGEVHKKLRHRLHRDRELKHSPKARNLRHNIHLWILRNLQPLLKPMIKLATKELRGLSDLLLKRDTVHQLCVFDKPACSDPSHSYLSKDHFASILNEPAGRIAQVVSARTLDLVIQAWEDSSIDPEEVARVVVRPIFHPSMKDPHSKIQREMMTVLVTWFHYKRDDEEQDEIIRRLGRDEVRDHQNVRFDGMSEPEWHWPAGEI